MTKIKPKRSPQRERPGRSPLRDGSALSWLSAWVRWVYPAVERLPVGGWSDPRMSALGRGPRANHQEET